MYKGELNMYKEEKGVLKNSQTFFHTPSNMAKNMFFYLKVVGHFFCTTDYKVERSDYSNFLLMYIKKGTGLVSFDNKTYVVHENDIIIIDCHKSHTYSSDNFETLWIHFDGSMSKQYFDLLYHRYGCVFHLLQSTIIPKYLNIILDSFKSNIIPNEPLVSCYIQRMLTELLLISTDTNNNGNRDNPVIKIMVFIKDNYKNKLTLEELSSKVNLSLFYFSRIFKKESGYTPYEYIIMIRINEAKRLLKSTQLSIKQIAFSTGFNSESNFVTCFKNNSNVTPKEFRNTPF